MSETGAGALGKRIAASQQAVVDAGTADPCDDRRSAVSRSSMRLPRVMSLLESSFTRSSGAPLADIGTVDWCR